MSHDVFSLQGQVALVTGAGKGMGIGIARMLGKLGASVAVNDLYEDRAQDTADMLVDEGIDAFPAHADVTQYESVKTMVTSILQHKTKIDILVSNAGVPADGMGYKKFLDSSIEDWQKFVNLNMFGLMNCCHAVVPGMKERSYGRVIAITSESWRAGLPMGIAAYAASKAGAVGFIRHLAAETGRSGVTVNALSLGTMNNWDSDTLAKKTCFVPRAGSPEDVGAGVAYFASKEAEWVTGQVLPLNGGSLTA
ncbi:SDR family NAD(P)-dependent oxidoreductase [Aliiglaciecola lipolytica]|uniref:3-oxoacyl-[acyl-carrier-protein] reductase 1 n=1 Tax=Aliiglaciecola lipolytica E3 TaxID=1127673 RepID=K6YRP3_9ALTE|nr:SDR family NAD(P)-dependent oxidoreductase [Aliiglaciecola lipolytica]GAC13990.1 3-oxoacyl-[acyl-carrier-protein] reductase 1 [Aliiglaciecola lipolytica E3]